MKYSYTAIDGAGRRRRAVIEAINQKTAEDQLKNEHIVSLTPHWREKLAAVFKRQGKNTDPVRFARELAVMLKVGVPLGRALDILALAFPEWNLGEVKQRISEGMNLGEALKCGGEQVPQAIAGSAERLRDPYTLKPMRWDAEKRRIYFEAKSARARTLAPGVEKGRVYLEL